MYTFRQYSLPKEVFIVKMLRILNFGFVVLNLLTILAFSSCSKREQSADLITLPLRGEVVEIDTTKGVVTIAHEEIPDYMSAMVMPFRVKDKMLLSGITIGDSVGGTLAISRSETWLATLQKLRHSGSPRVMSAEEVQLKDLFAPGQVLPEVLLVNQEGAKVRFSNYRGKAVALTFIYTRCPLPDYCIRMSEQFKKAQDALKQDASLNGRWHLLSLSFDSRYDRPAVLRRYGAQYGADLSCWDFLTDPDTSGKDVRHLAEGFGLNYINDAGTFTHNLRTAVLDKEGRLTKVLNGNAWEADEVVAEVKKAAQ